MLTFNSQNMTYDVNGNMTSVTNSCGTTTYTWDSEIDSLASPAITYDIFRTIEVMVTSNLVMFKSS
jgi:uncharacterized protein RhaS with RHS repeats